MLTKDTAFKPSEDILRPNDAVFTNPIGEKESPDPFVTYDDVYKRYYLLFTRGREVRIFSSPTLSTLRNEENGVKVYGIEQNDGIFGSIWAPEMHKIDGKWYIYTSGARTLDGREDRTLFVLASKTDDPLDGFTFAGFPDPSINAIDPTVYRHSDGKLYMCYAREGKGNRLHIRKMKSPTAFDGEGILLCEAELDWEKLPPYVGDSTIVEGAFFVQSPNKERLFILYSANGCWSDEYAIGVLEYKGGELVNKDSWEKDLVPLFKKGNGTFGPGHASYFLCPDKETLYIAYHSMHESNKTVTWAPRYLHVQKVYFDSTGFPYIGQPLPMGKSVGICQMK